MSGLFRFLGFIALINARLSLIRVNLVPLNLAIMAGLGGLTFISVVEMQDPATAGVGEGRGSLSSAVSGGAGKYAAIEGVLHPESSYELEMKSVGDITKVIRTWAPLIDRQHRGAILVELKDPAGQGLTPRRLTARGFLRPLSPELRHRLEEMGGRIDDVPIESDLMLVEGGAPGGRIAWRITGLVSAILFALFVYTFVRRYVIFVRDSRLGARLLGEEAELRGTANAIGLRATGKFRLDPKTSQRFLAVSAGVIVSDSGEIRIVSSIDASSRIMGITTASRVGRWTINLPGFALDDMEAGILYLGLAARPSIRLRYHDKETGRSESVVLSTKSQRELSSIFQIIARGQTLPLIPT